MKKRAISIFAAMCMAFSLLPGTALAAVEQVHAEEQVMTAENEESEEEITANENKTEQEGDSEESAAEAVDTKTPDIETPDIETPDMETPDEETSLDTEIEEDVPAVLSLERAGGVKTIVAEGYCGGEGDGKNLTWKLDSEGGLTVSGTGRMKNYDYGSSKSPWYENRSSITSVIIENGVSSIGNNAFECSSILGSWYSSLTSITMPSSITSIGSSAFYGCRSLTSIVIPDGVKSIGRSAFLECGKLASVTIPNSVTDIGEWAFSSCAMKTIVIPDSITTINYRTFSGGSFTNITIPSNIKSIGEEAFYGCGELTNITISDGVTSIGDSAFAYCGKLTNITLPDSVTSIGSHVFSSCKNLTSITLSNSLTAIGDNTFNGCIKLASIVIPNSVKSIGKYAFAGCNNLTSVDMSNSSVTSIGCNAFMVCPSLTSITIPSSVTYIGETAFAGCGLMSVTIPDGITSIELKAFSACNNLTEITIPNSVNTISKLAFDETTRLADIYYLGSRSQWNNILIDYSYEHPLNAVHNNCTGNDVLKRARIRCADEYYTLTGTITGHQGVAYQSVTAKLVGFDGKEYPVTVEGVELLNGANKNECTYFVSAFLGQYRLEVEATTTQGTTVYRSAVVNLAGNGQTKNINLPNGQAKSEVKVNKSGTKAVVGGLEDLVIDSNGDVAGGVAEVSMTIESVNTSAQEAVAIQNKAAGQTLDFFDFSIEKTVNGSTATKIRDTGNATVEIVLPFNSSGKKNVKVYRYHENQVDTLTEQAAGGEKIELTNGSITIYAKKFSVYAVGYTISNDGTSSSGSSNSGSGGGSSADSGDKNASPDIPVVSVPENPTVPIQQQQPKRKVANKPVAVQITKTDSGDASADTKQMETADAAVELKDAKKEQKAVDTKESQTPEETEETVQQPDSGISVWGIVGFCILLVGGAVAVVSMRKIRRGR